MDQSKLFLLGLGAQKTGTSWFATYLRSHPEVFISAIKEMHFFKYYKPNRGWPNKFFEKQLARNDSRAPDLRERLKFNDNISAYKAFFQNRIGSEKAFCEITPAYSFLPVSELERIRDNFDNVKLFFLMRNPADRFWSQLCFTNRKKPPKKTAGLVDETLGTADYVLRSDYRKTLNTVYRVFPENTLHIEFFEHLFTEEAVKRFCRFASLSFHPPKYDTPRNMSDKIEMSDDIRQRVVLHYQDQYRFVLKLFPNQIPKSWIKDIQRFLIV